METLHDPALLTDRLVQAAALSDDILAIDQADDGAWALAFQHSPVVLMEWAAAPDRIVLSAPVGVPAPERENEVYAAALSFTALWRESGGAKVAKGGVEGEMVLIRELTPDTDGGWDLLPVLEHFARVASWWEQFISSTTPLPLPEPRLLASNHLQA